MHQGSVSRSLKTTIRRAWSGKTRTRQRQKRVDVCVCVCLTEWDTLYNLANRDMSLLD